MQYSDLKRDCRLFVADRPCRPHKTQGVTCPTCTYYDPTLERILILKFDAMGDVLRTTSILHGVKRKFPRAHITWLTKKVSLDLFRHNPNVDQVLALEDPSAQWRLKAQDWDIVYSLDANPASASVAASVNAHKIIGFSLDAGGLPIALSAAAQQWMVMGVNDALKRANKRTFFDILFEYCELPHDPNFRPQLYLSPAEIEAAARAASEFGLKTDRPVIGLVPGAGLRWRYKRWNEAGFVELISQLRTATAAQVMLLWGEEDRPIVDTILRALPVQHRGIIVPQPGDLRHFAGLVNLVDLLICGDTLALHAGTALNKKIIAFFGPTSSAEIDLFNNGIKLVGDVPCQCCYLPDCTVRPTCMDSISVRQVMDATIELLGVPAAVPRVQNL